ncbi:MAG: hypothetical protein V4677_12840 [Bacteroidota bacterium]
MPEDNFIINPIDGRPMGQPPISFIGLILKIVIIILFAFWLKSRLNPSQQTTIDSCNYSDFIIPSTDTTINDKVYFEAGVAIEYFNVYKQIMKYDLTDSLPDFLKHDNRQTIYKITDQHAMYEALAKPILDSLKIKTVVGNFNDSLCTFMYARKKYTINTTFLKFQDGVILYIPGKKPILWTSNSERTSCNQRCFLNCYFSAK